MDSESGNETGSSQRGSWDELFCICERGLLAVGYELVELEHVRDQHGWVLRVYIDHPTHDQDHRSAISHADCVAASRHLGTVLDVDDPIAQAYRLEVSSPGVTRPIRKLSDFERFSGKLVRIKTLEPVEGRRNFHGVLLGVSGGDIQIDVGGDAYRLPLANIRKARLEEAPNAAEQATKA